MNSEQGAVGCHCNATVDRGAGRNESVGIHNHWQIECYGPDGSLKWSDQFDNIVVNAGLDDWLDKYLKGSTYTAAFYVGLTDGTPTFAASDTMSSHAGWSEVTAYSEATREALTLGTVSSQSVDNSASKASFSINSDSTTVGGMFISTDNTKGGTTGTLFAGGAFDAGDKSLDNGDTLNVTITVSAASA